MLLKEEILQRYQKSRFFLNSRFFEHTLILTLSGQLPLRKTDRRIIAPRTIAHWTMASRIIAPYTITPEDNCPRGKLPLGQLPPDYCPPDDCPWGQLPLDYCSRIITPKVIAPWHYTPGNCHRGKLRFGWFVAYIIAPRTNGPEENCPAGKLSQG